MSYFKNIFKQLNLKNIIIFGLSFSIFCTLLLTDNTVKVLASPTVSPQSAMDDINNPLFGLDFISCVEVLDWKVYYANPNNYNPYVNKGCQSDINVTINGSRTVSKDSQGKVNNVVYNIGNTFIRRTKYSDFSLGSQSAYNEFGNIPVLGVFPNSGKPAQNLNSYDLDGTLVGSVPAVDRSLVSNLNSIFTTEQLNNFFKNSVNRNKGLERLINTGPEEFVYNSNNVLVYRGGFCKVQNNKVVIRTAMQGYDPNGNYLSYPLNVADYGLDPNSPITTCGYASSYGATGNITVCNPSDFPNSNLTKGQCEQVAISSNSQYQKYVNLNCSSGNSCFLNYYDPDGIIRDQKLLVYQYVYKVPFPTDINQCNDWFPNVFSNYDSCINWFYNHFSVPLTGQTGGNNVCYVLNYYGGVNATREWIGWQNPDVYKVRRTFESNASLDTLRTKWGDDIAYLRDLFNDYTSSDQAIIGMVDGANNEQKALYTEYLRSKYEAFIRGADGYSTYQC